MSKIDSETASFLGGFSYVRAAADAGRTTAPAERSDAPATGDNKLVKRTNHGKFQCLGCGLECLS